MALTSTHTPSILALTRQNLPQLEGSSIEKANKGAYVLHEEQDAAITLLGTGSEVALAVETAEVLKKKGIKARVVSMPCMEVFRSQDKDYKLSVLPDGAPIMSIEAYTVSRLFTFSSFPFLLLTLPLLQTFGWGEFSHSHAGIDQFGASAPAKAVYNKFGLTGDALAGRAEKTINYFKGLNQNVYSPISQQLNV